MMLQVKRTRSITAASSKETISKKRKTVEQVQQKGKEETLPRVQPALKLHAIRQPYEVSADHALPSIQHDSELLVKVQAVGLNPIDWKAPYELLTQHHAQVPTNNPPATTTSASQPFPTYPAENTAAQSSSPQQHPPLASKKATASSSPQPTIAIRAKPHTNTTASHPPSTPSACPPTSPSIQAVS